MVEKEIEFMIPCGMHIRPATILSDTASRYNARTKILFKHHIINSSSILNLIASGIRSGDVVTVQCDGIEEKEALAAVEKVMQDKTIKL